MSKLTFDEIGQRFQDLLEQVDSAGVRVPEDSAFINLASDLVPHISRLLRRGIELLDLVESRYDGDEPDVEGADTLQQIGIQISAEFASRDLIDLAFFARTDVRNALESLINTATHKREIMALASSCESGLRRLRKALVSVESALYEYEGQEAPERKWFDVEISLQIRRLYWNLRRETGDREATAGDSLEKRLRSVLYRIVAFRELSVYPFLRVDDRVQLRQLVKRILEWLNSDQRDSTAARQLWEDLAIFADILVHVSHRQELREHDLLMVSKAHRILFAGGNAAARVPTKLASQMEGLLGLDDDLDRLILQGTSAPVEAFRSTLERLLQSLDVSHPAAAAVDLWSE